MRSWKQIFKKAKCLFVHFGHDWERGVDLKRHLDFMECSRCKERIIKKGQLVHNIKKMRKNNQRINFY